ncbi:dienelactone hydrolase family protein [Marivibrio halodurans]|uniref:Dienelactone hydrolase family protein n=1 Tax=Marivibrio halodurans TaxID=2039722 RepID=A0A8J7RXF2_9PROT|nr:dienelactone hydrolase family protein [Marivibrio halodurans]MBP5856517.1 dienelactone hydrolase family protein [Marivibrio halodurans]
MLKMLCKLLAIFYMAVLGGCQTMGPKITDLSDGRTGQVYYESYLDSDLTLTGSVQLPESVSGPVPAIILAHGSAGVGYRESTWGSFFREKGYATMVIDMFGPRGFKPMSGPNVGGYDDIIDAFNILKTHPMIDPDRIAVMGWSFGGGNALNAASMTRRRGEGHALKAFVSFYPVCGVSAVPFIGEEDAKILVVIGTEDTYTEVFQCERIVEKGKQDGRDVQLIVYEGAYHGFDGNLNTTFFHGKFGRQRVKPSATITMRARRDVLTFLEASM